MRFPLRHGSTLLKYFLSYLIILAVSFIGLYFIVNFRLKIEYKTAYEKEIDLKLSNLTKMISQSFMDIQQTNYLIENDVVFINARYSESNYLRYTAVTELKKYAMLNALVQDILYIDIKNSDLISANSRCMNQDGHVYIKSSEGDIYIPDKLIYSNNYNNTIYLIKSYGRTFYLFLCPKNSVNYRVIYILSERQLYTLINMYTAIEVTAVGLICNDEVVLSTKDDIVYNIGEMSGISGGSVSINGSTELYIQNIGFPGLTLAVIIDKTFLREYVNIVFRNSYLIMAAFVILGFTIVFVSMKMTYSPLHKLMKRITNKTGYKGDDITALSHAFDESVDEKNALIEKINYYKGMIKKTVLLSQSKLKQTEDRHIDEKIDELFSEDFCGIIFVAILVFRSDMNDSVVFEYAGFQLEKNSSLITLESMPGQLTLLINLPDSNDDNDHAVTRLFCAIREKYPCKIAYSDYSVNPMDIARLYDKAKLAQKFLDKDDIVSYSMINSFTENNLIPPYPYQLFDELSVHLKQLDFDKARETMDNLFQIIDMENSPMLFVRCILIDALTLLSTSMNDNAVKFDSYRMLFLETLYLCRSSRYNETKDEILEKMQAILAIFSAEISGIGIHTSQIIKFVEENCLSSDFSLTYLADSFNVSVAYMSALFMKKFNVNLSDYVWNIRFAMAKTLLETTNDSIEEICSAVGYDIPSSFRRRFKQAAGISPLEYKRRVSKNDYTRVKG